MDTIVTDVFRDATPSLEIVETTGYNDDTRSLKYIYFRDVTINMESIRNRLGNHLSQAPIVV